jgi:hypothetical protein
VLSQIDAQLQRVCPGCVPSISEIPNQVAFGTDLSGFDPPISLDGTGLDTQGGVKDGTQQAGGGGAGGGGGTQDPELLDPLDPVLDPDGGGQTSGGGNGGGNALTETVDDLTQALLGDGGTTSGNDDGTTDGGLLGQLEDSVDDTTGGLVNP